MATGLSGLMGGGGSGPHRITVTDRYDITVAAAPGTSIQWTLDTVSGDSVSALGGGWWPDSDPQPLNPLTDADGLGVVDPPIGGAIVVPDGALGARIILNAQDMDFNVGTAVADVTLGDWAPVVPVDPRPAYVWSGSEWVPIGGGAGSSGGVPVGTVVAWAGQPTAVPRGWLLCDGQAVPASSALAGMLSHVPDLRARFVMGAHPGSFDASTSGGSRKITVDNLPSHDHGGVTGVSQPMSGGHTYILQGEGYAAGRPTLPTLNGINSPQPYSAAHAHAVNAQGNGTDYLPPYYTLAYIIRSELTADDIADLTTLDARYVNVDGDSMTGQLGVRIPGGEQRTLIGAGVYIDRFNTAGSGPQLTFRKTRSADESHTVVASGDILGNLSFQGSDGAAYRQAAAIRGAVTGTPAAGDVRGVLTFACRDADDGQDAPSVKMRVDGNAITANVPVILPADPAAAMQAATKQYVDAHAGTPTLYSFRGELLTGGNITVPGGTEAATVPLLPFAHSQGPRPSDWEGSEYVVPVAGYYYVGLVLTLTVNNGWCYYSITLNGANVMSLQTFPWTSGGLNGVTWTCHDVMYLAAGTKVGAKVWGLSAGGNIVIAPGYRHTLHGYRIGA